MRTLQLHMTGQDVLNAQSALTAAGFYTGDIDGCFGPCMARAVASFQKDKQLNVSGEIETATASTLGLQDRQQITSALPQVTPELVQTNLFPQTPLNHIQWNLAYVLNALAELQLSDHAMIAVALATLRTEAASFLPVSEHVCSLNTGPDSVPFGLYVHRLGNDTLVDAANYRGRGFIQITGKYNYAAYSKKLFGDDRLLTNPLLAHDSTVASRVLAQFLKDREQNIRAALRQGKLNAVRALVNGGVVGQSTFEVAYGAMSEVIDGLHA